MRCDAVRMQQAIAPMTTSGAARCLGCAEGTVRDLERRGLLHAARTASGLRLFDPAEVARLAEARAEAARRKRHVVA